MQLRAVNAKYVQVKLHFWRLIIIKCIYNFVAVKHGQLEMLHASQTAHLTHGHYSDARKQDLCFLHQLSAEYNTSFLLMTDKRSHICCLTTRSIPLETLLMNRAQGSPIMTIPKVIFRLLPAKHKPTFLSAQGFNFKASIR